MRARDILILTCGETAPSVRIRLGSYDRWFQEALGGAVRPHVVAGHLGAPLPDPRRFDAVIATGSPRSVTEGAPWMRRAAEWLLSAAEHRVPVLGVCFGHQLLGAALGGRVRRSPRGREIGTVACTLSEAGRADPLFDGVPGTFEVQTTHEDEVEPAPPGALALATNGHSALQAFRAGAFLRGVQFHPEMSQAQIAALAVARATALGAEARARGDDPAGRVRAVLGGVRPTPWGARVLENFLSGGR